ncbi:D-2-hydroxyacid dehydrogenase [Flagellimonas myxillae]|uniref:D-2-hydroxyacid dehydrogenase n=1 Tax=Flagellimonas myxillae TaxID=2942214 RepID=UPI00201FB1F5|nr:D-2-hydroxyacid dehydrogenase [Muricauda myxillae]MCL6266059.1 D-2-hydroxyacid dehydrogenase [Muricauda myxillae]
MKTVLANDGLSQAGIALLEKEGFKVLTTKVAQEQLSNFINDNQVRALLVRSATQVDKTVIDACPDLELIGRGGVGMDNIDVDHAKGKGIHVINTPASSSSSVAELVFAHLFSGARYLHDANRNMPLEGDSKFKQLKKSYANGMELRGKTLGVIGFGRIGQATARIGLALGMRVIYTDHNVEDCILGVPFFDGQSLSFSLKASAMEEVLQESDFITIHVPAQNGYVLSAKEFDMMKTGAAVINAARGGVLDEVALVDALEKEKLSFAGLDVYESEPNPEIRILMHPKISLTPHTGASTQEAQERIGVELAKQVASLIQ